MILKTIVVGEMSVNCYIVGDAKTQEVFVIDPGGDYEKIKAIIDKNGYKVRSIINTHGHIDHIAANKNLGFPVWIHADDAEFLVDAGRNLSFFLGSRVVSPKAAKLLKEGDVLAVGDVSLQVIHTPGHTPGSICLKADSVLFSGDTLFSEGIGRTDFPYGSQKRLLDSLKEKLLILDDDTIVYPGHGPSTSIGREKKGNPFL